MDNNEDRYYLNEQQKIWELKGVFLNGMEDSKKMRLNYFDKTFLITLFLMYVLVVFIMSQVLDHPYLVKLCPFKFSAVISMPPAVLTAWCLVGKGLFDSDKSDK
ncbi:hypothetical protein [Candidatus Liberibacter africanus]|uniref:Phage-associated protein n=1 Tax=Candidatus Liberibacter africanus PTSAPSY TaxID=1277257 RepID=A0A0G3I3S1_LIBAF|nr:hypothetical protein [Candidatus Liberibacter africanus]AKK20516.1 phage-associated protein [Candidatus Liberibacter africanus PTSAPSY]